MEVFSQPTPPFHARPYVLFDFDGTLADTMPGIVATATRVLLTHGFTTEQIGDASRLVGPPFPEAFSLVYGVDAAEAASITADYRAIYDHLGVESHPLFPGIRELLQALHAADKHLVIASSKRQEIVEPALERLEIRELFSAVCAKQEEGHGTKPEIISAALATVGATPETCVMVGDRSYDIEGAHACGLPCIAVEFGTAPHEELVQSGAEAIVQSASELAHVLLPN